MTTATALALQQEGGDPASELYRTIHRVAERLEGDVREPFLEAVRQMRGQMDEGKLLSALRKKDVQAVENALGFEVLSDAQQWRVEPATDKQRSFLSDLLGIDQDDVPAPLTKGRASDMIGAMETRRGFAGSKSQLAAAMRDTLDDIRGGRKLTRGSIRETMNRLVQASGSAVAQEFASSVGVEFSFDAVNPNAVMAARQNAATLVARVSDETRQGLRNVVSGMFTEGVPPEKAAREIRTMVGLREQHMKAVRNFRSQVEAGDLAAVDRRLDAATKQRIRSAIDQGNVTPQFVDDVAETYRKSLLNRRANDISRTETIRASHAGQQETWRQAADEGHIDRNEARRVWIVTPDSRLRASHAAIPTMNPNGVGMEEPFRTPMGAMMYPPAGVNCRCSTSIAPGGLSGGII